MWLILLALHVVGIVGFNLTLRKLLTEKDRLDPWQLATIMQIGIAIPIVFVGLVAPPDITNYGWQEIGLIAVICAFVVALHVSNVKALQYLEAGVYAVFYNLRIIITTLLGIMFLQEDVIPLRILGGLLIFLAVFVVRQKGRKALTARGIRWGITAAFVISVLNMFEKELIGRIGWVSYAVPVMIVTTVVMLGISAAMKKNIQIAMLKQPQIVQLMTLRTVSAYSFGLALGAGGLLSVSNYISSLSVIVLVALGILLLNERDYLKRKIMAGAIALVGLTVILIANHMT